METAFPLDLFGLAESNRMTWDPVRIDHKRSWGRYFPPDCFFQKSPLKAVSPLTMSILSPINTSLCGIHFSL